MPTFNNSEGNIAIFMKAKEAMIRKSAFPKSFTNLSQLPAILFGLAYTNLTKKLVAQALTIQSATKASGLDKISFQVLQIIWSWKKAHITNIVYHAIRLGYHPRT